MIELEWPAGVEGLNMPKITEVIGISVSGIIAMFMGSQVVHMYFQPMKVSDYPFNF